MAAENVRTNSPYPTIDRFPGRPDFDAIVSVHVKLKSNAAFIHSNLVAYAKR